MDNAIKVRYHKETCQKCNTFFGHGQFSHKNVSNRLLHILGVISSQLTVQCWIAKAAESRYS